MDSPLGRKLSDLGKQWAALQPKLALIETFVDASSSAGELKERLDRQRRKIEDAEAIIRWYQEELDWVCYEAYGLASAELSPFTADMPGGALAAGHRPSDILFARQVLEGQPGRRYFELCHLPQPEEIAELELNKLAKTRLAAIRDSSELSLIEQPRYKRTFRESFRPFDPSPGLRGYLLRRLEQTAASVESNKPQSATTRQLAATLHPDPAVNAVAEVLTGESSPNLERLFNELIGSDAVPYLAAYRYSDSGLEKRSAWEETWELQRREDSGDDIDVPVPPRYTSKDFRSPVYWRHRGKLDVPKERFISYPDAASDDDGANTIVLGWAGWDHSQQATALAELYQRRKTQDGWGAERLIPLLAGIDELVPWLKQWHNEPDPIYGQRLGDQYATFVESEAHSLGLSVDDLKKWRPPKKTRGRSTRRGSSGKGRRPTLTPDDLLAAIGKLADESGVEQRQLAEELGVSGATVARVADQLIAEGRLVVVSGRPKRFQLAGAGP